MEPGTVIARIVARPIITSLAAGILLVAASAWADKNWKTSGTPGANFEDGNNYVEGSAPTNDTTSDTVIFGYKGRVVPDPATKTVWLDVIKRTGFVVFIK